MVQPVGAAPKERVLAWLQRWLRFHRKWRTLTMLAYATTTIISIVAATAGGIVAALNVPGWSNNVAAVLAGVTAVALAIEKTLLFREKWRLHLTAMLALDAIELKCDTGQIPATEAVEEATKVLKAYGHDLPIGTRDS